MKEREKEMEADDRDRQREKEEIEELRRKLTEEGHSDVEGEVARVSTIAKPRNHLPHWKFGLFDQCDLVGWLYSKWLPWTFFACQKKVF